MAFFRDLYESATDLQGWHTSPPTSLSCDHEQVPGKGIVDQLLASINLLVDLALIIIPNLAPPRREYGLHAQEIPHTSRLEDAATGIRQWRPSAVNEKAGS